MKPYAKILDTYCAAVLSGGITTGTYTRRAVERFRADMHRAARADFPFEYVQQEADKVLAFAETLRPGDLNGAALALLPWQVFCLSNLEGWRHKNDHARKRFRTAYIEVNRKNGKTTGLLFPLVLYNFLKYKAAESYIVSSSDTLSEKTFKEVADIIHAEPELDRILDCRSLAITFKDEAEKSRIGFYCDGGKSVDGLRPRFAAIDEYHDFASDKMLDSMTMGMRSKKDAQCVMITTADTNIACACYEQNAKARRVLTGTQSQDDFFAVIYALDEGDDYHDSAVWQKANPSLYDIIDPSIIQSDIDNAELTPHKIPEFKAKTFGIWGGGGEKSWLALDTWQKNARDCTALADFDGAECFCGLDLAQVDDLCAFTKLFLRGGKEYYFHRFYIPEGTARARYRKENINFLQWVARGIVTAIPGETIDYSFIIRDILSDAERYKIRGIGYDKWQAREVIQGIEDARPDIALIEIEQSLRKLSPLTQSYEKTVKDGRLVDNSPVMLWMINNVEIKPDVNGNYKPLKKSKASTQRIDGVVSSIMAHGVAHNPAMQSPTIRVEDMIF